MKIFGYLILVLTLASCSLPRGAALESEIIAPRQDRKSEFAVYAVTRASLPRLASWPHPDKERTYRWLAPSTASSDIPIAPNDRISLTIWDSDENSLLTAPGQKSVRIDNTVVSAKGTIFVPYIGDIRISGLSAGQARIKLQEALSSVAPSAQVQVSVNPGQRSSVDLVGGVANPGNYPLTDENLTVLNLISKGGGVAATLRNPQLRLVRQDRIYGISLARLYASPQLDVPVRGGDKVIVTQDTRFFRALGAAGTEKIVPFTTDRPTALDAISMIGGLLDSRANPAGVLILREYPKWAVRRNGRGPSDQRVIFTLDLTTADGIFSAGAFAIRPGDTVLVTEASVKSAETVLGLIGNMFGVFRAATK